MEIVTGLCEDHRVLEDMADTLLAALDQDQPDVAAIAMQRWQFGCALRDHCAREDALVYDWLLASGDAQAVAAAWRFRQEHGRLLAAFGRYAGSWPVDRIAAECAAFRAATERLLGALAQRIAAEEGVLYGHLARVRACRCAA